MFPGEIVKWKTGVCVLTCFFLSCIGVSVCYCLPAMVWWCWPWYQVARGFLSAHLLSQRTIQCCDGKCSLICMSDYHRKIVTRPLKANSWCLQGITYIFYIFCFPFSVGALWFSLETRKVLNTDHSVNRLLLCRDDQKCNTFLPKRLCLRCFHCNCRNLLTSSRMKLYFFFFSWQIWVKILDWFIDMLGLQKRVKCLN